VRTAAATDISWHGWPAAWGDDGADTVVSWGTDRLYFFRNSEYLRYSIADNRVDFGPRAIARGPGDTTAGWGNWPAAWTNVDAAVNIGSTTDANDYQGIYMFRGSEYIRYDVPTDQVPAGYPKSIADNWTGLNAAGFGTNIDYVFKITEGGKRYLVFVRGQMMVKYDLDDGGGAGHANEGVVADSNKPIYGAGNYPGLAFFRQPVGRR
jgi:hypothetical protein